MAAPWVRGGERLRMVLSGAVADRVPVVAQLHEHARVLQGVSPRRFYTDARLFVETLLATWEMYDLDWVFMCPDVYNLLPEALGQAMAWYDDQPPEIDSRCPLCGEGDDFRPLPSWELVDLSHGRLEYGIDILNWFHRLTGLEPDFYACGAFSLACNLRGYRTLVSDTKERPQAVSRFLEHLVDHVLVPWLEKQRAVFPGTHLALVADAWGSLPNVNPPLFSAFVAPPALRLREALAGKVTVMHAGYWGDSKAGDPTRFMREKIALAGCLLGLDPDLEEVPPSLFARVAREEGVPLGLGVGATFLEQATTDDIRRRVMRYVREGRAAGPLFLMLNEVTARTPPEHVHAVVNAARGG